MSYISRKENPKIDYITKLIFNRNKDLQLFAENPLSFNSLI